MFSSGVSSQAGRLFEHFVLTTDFARAFACHVGQVVRAVAQHAILLRPKEMHDGVNGFKNFVRHPKRLVVDNIN